MNWFLLTLACVVFWSITDILYKASSPQNDPLSHYKTFVWIGIVMALAGGIMSTWSDTLLDSIKVVKNDLLYLIPLGLIYAGALFFGLLGKKHLAASVVSSLENIGGALVAIIIYYYYLLTGYILPSYKFGIIDFIATASIIIGVILIGREEQALLKQEVHLEENKKKHRLGALALFFPIIYTLIDVFSVAEIGGISGNSGITDAADEIFIPAMDFFIFECVGIALVSIGVWFYLWIVKKHLYNPFQPEEFVRCSAATSETFGTMAFIFAAEINPVLTAPITSFHCLLTIVLARIFLKERLSKKQYISLGFVVLGIVLIGFADIFGL
jgi:drug/metabolite transporter (DMT)-like permease